MNEATRWRASFRTFLSNLLDIALLFSSMAVISAAILVVFYFVWLGLQP